MLTRSELHRTKEYWIDRIQNDIFRALHAYKEANNLKNNTALAKKLGVSKGYISQVMNGNFNFSLTKLVDLALTLNMAPDLELKSIESYTVEEEARLQRLQNPSSTIMISLRTGNNFEINLDEVEEDPSRIAG